MMSEDLPRKLPVVIAFSYEDGCERTRERDRKEGGGYEKGGS